METETVILRNGEPATVFSVPGKERDNVPYDLLEQMHELFMLIIDEGQTYPNVDKMTVDEFKEFWMSKFCNIMVKGEHNRIAPGLELLGTHFIKPNYIGRCSHVANGGFLVNQNTRGQGIGKELGKCYLKWGPKLGYEYSVFNLVFETNVASLRTWDSLGFDRIGRIPNAAHLKGYDKPVTAIMYGKSLV